MNEQIVWIRGPVIKTATTRRVLNGTYFGMVWTNGFAGPFSEREARTRMASLPSAKMVYENPFPETAVASEAESVEKQQAAAYLKSLEEENAKLITQRQELTKKVKELEAAEVSAGGPVPYSPEDVKLAFDDDVNFRKKGAARKRLMEAVGFDLDKFEKQADAWKVFESDVLPHLKQ